MTRKLVFPLCVVVNYELHCSHIWNAIEFQDGRAESAPAVDTVEAYTEDARACVCL